MACLSAANLQKVSNAGVSPYSLLEIVTVNGGGDTSAKWSWEHILERLLHVSNALLSDSREAAPRFMTFGTWEGAIS